MLKNRFSGVHVVWKGIGKNVSVVWKLFEKRSKMVLWCEYYMESDRVKMVYLVWILYENWSDKISVAWILYEKHSKNNFWDVNFAWKAIGKNVYVVWMLYETRSDNRFLWFKCYMEAIGRKISLICECQWKSDQKLYFTYNVI